MAVVRGGTRNACAARQRRRVAAGDQTRRRRLDVAFHAGNLPCEQEEGIRARLPRLVEDGWSIDVRIPVDHAEPHELRLLEPGNHAQHSRLLAPLQLRLKPDETVMIAGEIVLAELNGRVRLTAGPRVPQPDRFHRPEPQRILAAMRHYFDGKAPFEELLLVEVMNRRGFGRCERRIERAVLSALSGQFR